MARLPAEPVLVLDEDGSGQPRAGVGRGTGLAFVKAYFPLVQQQLRIATAFFSFKGYEMARGLVAPQVQLSFLICNREADRDQMRNAVVEELAADLQAASPPRAQDSEVLAELEYELTHGALQPLEEAVADLLDRLRKKQCRIRDARWVRPRYHCKFYLCDQERVFHGSANFSINGLRDQAEQLSLITDPTIIESWGVWYEQKMDGAVDLVKVLSDMLEDWLKLATPYQVYLRALELLLTGRKLTYSNGAHPPVHYQEALANWAVHQLYENQGALLVVATGLGKTIIGAEVAGLLRESNALRNVVLLAPQAVHREWRTQLTGRNLEKRELTSFNGKLLFRKEKTPNERHQLDQLLDELMRAGPETLIIIDEAQEYRNEHQRTQSELARKQQRHHSRVFERLQGPMQRGARILLLTGSAYGTNLRNLTSLLRLLPPPRPMIDGGLMPAPEWEANSLSDFARLPVTSIFAYPHALQLARRLGHVQAECPYLPYTDTARGYLPRLIDSRFVLFEAPVWEAVSAAFRAGCFAQEDPIPSEGWDDRHGRVAGLTDGLRNCALAAWLGSPLAFLRCLEMNLATPGPAHNQAEELPLQPPKEDGSTSLNGQFTFFPLAVGNTPPRPLRGRPKVPGYNTRCARPLADRETHLRYLLNCFSARTLFDEKLKNLETIIRRHCVEQPERVLIFVGLHLTASYLENKLNLAFPRLQIASTVLSDGSGLKSADVRRLLRQGFAPAAQSAESSIKQYEVLICTDADGVGVNLQDARVIVNYDVPNAADVLVQRLGRILRPTAAPHRVPQVYTFWPACLSSLPPDQDGVEARIKRRYDRLRQRHDTSSELLTFQVLPKGLDLLIQLDYQVDLEAYEEQIAPGEHKSVDVNLTTHLAVLDQHHKNPIKLPVLPQSARTWPRLTPWLLLLVRLKNLVQPFAYDLKASQFQPVDRITFLNWLHSDAQTEKAPVSDRLIRACADRVVQELADTRGVTVEQVERLAVLYLHPQHLGADMSYLFRSA